MVIETKTGTAEHEAPSGAYQTHAYVEAVRRYYALPDGHPVHIGFLTTAGDEAQNPEAVSITLVQLLEKLAAGFDGSEVPGSTRYAIGLAVTHLLAHAAPNGVDAAAALRSFLTWPDRTMADTESEEFVRRLAVVRTLQVAFKEHRS